MQLSDAMHLFNEGRNVQSYRLLGAHPDATGTVFRVWAPNAVAEVVVVDFNGCDVGGGPMHCLVGGRVHRSMPGAMPYG